MNAAKRFLNQSVDVAGRAPVLVTTDGHDFYPRAVREALGREVIHRCNPSLNNRLEQDHCGIKQRYYSMRGFARVATASRFCSAFDEVPRPVPAGRNMFLWPTKPVCSANDWIP